MKKLTLVLAAIVMGFVMTSCNTTSKSDTIKKATDEYRAWLKKKKVPATQPEFGGFNG